MTHFPPAFSRDRPSTKGLYGQSFQERPLITDASNSGSQLKYGGPDPWYCAEEPDFLQLMWPLLFKCELNCPQKDSLGLG